MNIKRIILDIVLFSVPIFLLWITHSEIIVSVVAILVMIGTLFVSKVKREWLLFVVGVFFGVVIEVGSDQIYQLQYWESGLLLGIPLWLPIYWGFVFVFVRRIGNEVVKG